MTAPPPTTADIHFMLAELTRRELDAQARVRTWRNVTLYLCLALAVLLPLFALIAPHVGNSLVRIHAMTDAHTTTRKSLSSGDLLAVELWGGLGGLVGVISSVSRIRLSAVNVGLRVAQLLLKPLAGGAIALFGIVAVQGQLFTQLQPLADTSVAAYAAVFGFAQEALTRFIDQRARSLLDTASPTASERASSTKN